MEIQALTRNARMSPKKVREVARLIQGRPVNEAIDFLTLVPRKSARLIVKTLKSAIANAENNNNITRRPAHGAPRPHRERSRAQALQGRRQGHGQAARQAHVAHPHRPLRRQNQLIFPMGQKTNPTGFRLAVRRNWQSRWFARKKDFAKLLLEDQIIRTSLMEKLKQASVPRIFIERAGNRVRVKIYTARPGIVIGRRARRSRTSRKSSPSSPARKILLDIQEVKKPEIEAQLVAENVALQLERRIAFRRAMKKAVEMAMSLGIDGIRIQCSGRLGGADIARREWQRKGRVPLHTLRENIDYGFAEAQTVYGKIGVKCWICKKTNPTEHSDLGFDFPLASRSKIIE
jgi:small subunit ribosomal protein S3